MQASGWLRERLAQGCRVVIPAIADYEVRRELLRAGKASSLKRLDALHGPLDFSPISTAALRKAAELWAQARNSGQPTADPKALDGDVILAAQALMLVGEGDELVVATTNPGHLARFVPATVWDSIT